MQPLRGTYHGCHEYCGTPVSLYEEAILSASQIVPPDQTAYNLIYQMQVEAAEKMEADKDALKILTAVQSAAAAQAKREDYIYCDSMDADTLVQKGHARRNGCAGDGASDNVITEGSRIAVNAGQMLIVVENGQIVDFTAEQGGYEYKRETSPSMFCGKFGDALKASFQQMKERFAFGG